MKKTPTITTWLLGAPLKFATLSFITMFVISFLYTWISNLVGIDKYISTTPILSLITIGIIGCIFYTIKKVPKITMDQESFIAIHNAQTLLSFILFILSGYLLLANQQYLIHGINTGTIITPGALMILTILFSIFLLYTLGLTLINLYVKFKRIQELKIPTWKIICSIPFGFSALWLPGYLTQTNKSRTPGQPIKSKWYSRINTWILSNPTNTIATFVFITIISGFYVGFSTTLLTFSMALIYGIWTLKIGAKKFSDRIPGAYSTTAVIINITLIIVLSMAYIFMPQSQNIEITINETTTQTTQGTAQ